MRLILLAIALTILAPGFVSARLQRPKVELRRVALSGQADQPLSRGYSSEFVGRSLAALKTVR